MNSNKLKDIISGNVDLSQMQKGLLTGFVMRSEERENAMQEDRKLVEAVANEKNVDEIILSTDEVKIYTVRGKEEWQIKYPFRSIYKDAKGNWVRCGTVSPNLDVATLVYLSNKYSGANGQFADYAIKMLGIKIEE